MGRGALDCTRRHGSSKQRVLGRIEQFKDLLKADEVVLALSDRANFRRKLFPDINLTEGSQYYLSS